MLLATSVGDKVIFLGIQRSKKMLEPRSGKACWDFKKNSPGSLRLIPVVALVSSHWHEDKRKQQNPPHDLLQILWRREIRFLHWRWSGIKDLKGKKQKWRMSRVALGGFYLLWWWFTHALSAFSDLFFSLSVSSNNFVLSPQANQGAQREYFSFLSLGRLIRSFENYIPVAHEWVSASCNESLSVGSATTVSHLYTGNGIMRSEKVWLTKG
jgi:hypothetical protein